MEIFLPYDKSCLNGNSYIQADRYEQLFGPLILKWNDEVRSVGGYLQGWNVEIDVELLNKVLLSLLLQTRSLVVEGVQVGFNPFDGGDWADRLFANNGDLTIHIKILELITKEKAL